MRQTMWLVLIAVLCLGASEVWADDITVNSPDTLDWYGGYSTSRSVSFYGNGTVNWLSNADAPSYSPEVFVNEHITLNVYDAPEGQPQPSTYKGLSVSDEAVVNIFGGKCSGIDASGNSTVNVYGSNFEISTDGGANWISVETQYVISQAFSGMIKGTRSDGTTTTAFEGSYNISETAAASGAVIKLLAPASSSPADMLSDLGQFIENEIASGAIDARLAKSLSGKVDKAAEALDRGKRNAVKVTTNHLNALINQVQAQAGKKIDTDTAESIVDQAEAIITEIND